MDEEGVVDGEVWEMALGAFLLIWLRVEGRGLDERMARARGAAVVVDIVGGGCEVVVVLGVCERG